MLVLNYSTSWNPSEYLLASSLILEFRKGYDWISNPQGAIIIAPTALCNGLVQYKLVLVNWVQVALVGSNLYFWARLGFFLGYQELFTLWHLLSLFIAFILAALVQKELPVYTWGVLYLRTTHISTLIYEGEACARSLHHSYTAKYRNEYTVYRSILLSMKL